MGTSLKYTDRDVRENPEFFDYAVDYLRQYEGEFAFLVDCKMRVASGWDLSVGMVRGVLNCMRNDPRVTGIPDPQVWDDDEVENVIPLKRKKKRSRDRYRDDWCENTEPHGPHRDENYVYSCPGLYLVNRQSFRLPLKVKREHVTAKGGSLIHRVAPDGNHNSVWNVPPHDYGWYDFWSPDYNIKLACKFPSWLKNPMLLTEEEAIQFTELPEHAGQRVFCVRCFR